jgi:hypothetical protein
MKDRDEIKKLKKLLVQAYQNEDWYVGAGIVGANSEEYKIVIYCNVDNRKNIIVDDVKIEFKLLTDLEACNENN